jgi:hypothetical protein
MFFGQVISIGYPGKTMIRLIALAVFLAPAAFPQQQLIDWLNNYPEALKVSKETGKPILLEFRCEA